jgi:hypothetical protein
MMRKLLYIFGFLLCVACSESAKKSQDAAPTSDEWKVKESNYTEGESFKGDSKRKDADLKILNIEKYKVDEIRKDDAAYSFTTNYFSLDDINTEISTKLQANYEAQLLATKHPEFAEAIKEQLTASNKFHTALSDSIQTIKIEDLEFLGSLKSLNDSVSTQKMRYTSVINSKYKQKDSVLVVVKRAMILIDDVLKANTSFTFEKLD